MVTDQPTTRSPATHHGYVWLVVNANHDTVSVFGDEVAAKEVVAKAQESHPVSNWRVERWAIR